MTDCTGTSEKALVATASWTWSASRLFHLLPAILLIALCGVSAYRGYNTVSEIDWSFLFDSYRDIGIAQSMLDGRYPEDCILSGEYSWYNPGTGFCIAAIAKCTGIPVHLAGTRAGVFLNLLVPIGLFVLASRLYGRWMGAIAVVFLVLANPTQKGYDPVFMMLGCAITTYMPWLWAPHLAQGFFFLAMAAYWKALSTRRAVWYAATGALLGVTFMFHTAPALLLGLTVLATVWNEARESQSRSAVYARLRSALFHGLLTAAIAFVISLPYTLPILAKYQFHIRNMAPSVYQSDYFLLSTLPRLLRDLLTPTNAITLLGVAALLRRRRWEPRTVILLAWGGISVAFLVYSYIWQKWPALPHPITPAHHFMISLTAWKTIVFAVGVAALWHAGTWLWTRRAHAPSERDLQTAPARVCVAVVCLLLWIYTTPYRAYEDFRITREKPVYLQSWDLVRCVPLYEWMLASTQPDDVFLIENVQAEMKAVLPAGRKLVAGSLLIFLNPYVDCEKRSLDRQRLFDALQAGNEEGFMSLAGTYRVSHVILDKARPQPPQPDFLEPVFQTDDFSVYRIARNQQRGRE